MFLSNLNDPDLTTHILSANSPSLASTCPLLTCTVSIYDIILVSTRFGNIANWLTIFKNLTSLVFCFLFKRSYTRHSSFLVSIMKWQSVMHLASYFTFCFSSRSNCMQDVPNMSPGFLTANLCSWRANPDLSYWCSRFGSGVDKDCSVWLYSKFSSVSPRWWWWNDF